MRVVASLLIVLTFLGITTTGVSAGPLGKTQTLELYQGLYNGVLA